jgi:hypothetical protein
MLVVYIFMTDYHIKIHVDYNYELLMLYILDYR